MYALALRVATTPASENDRAMRLIDGANTLRWCDENDPDSDPCDGRFDELASALDDVRAAVLAWDTSTGTKRHAELRDEIAEILAEAGL
jgi:hypothetical protein